MKNTKEFSLMTAEQLMEVNGGGFAYDLGRLIRIVALGGGIHAYVDYVYNDSVNKAIQAAENE